jgi:hypothetical protein
MPWITPTLTLCKTRLTGAEYTALSSAAKSSSQEAEAMAQQVIDTVVTRIRGRVPATVKLGAAGTIPDELQGAFLSLWVYEFITRLPQMKSLLDELRVKSWDNANSELRDLAAGRINLVSPIDAAPANQQAAGPAVEVAQPARVIQSITDSGLL